MEHVSIFLYRYPCSQSVRGEGGVAPQISHWDAERIKRLCAVTLTPAEHLCFAKIRFLAVGGATAPREKPGPEPGEANPQPPHVRSEHNAFPIMTQED